MRTFGAVDLKPRKKRTHYAGKKIKRKRKSSSFRQYVSTRDRDAPIKIWFWVIRRMSVEASKRFSKKTRAKMRKITYKPYIRVDVPPEMLSTKEAVSELCLSILPEGDYLLKTFSHAKNKYHVTNRAVAQIFIKEHPEGLRCKVIPSYKKRGLYRYWFWAGR